jgi:hypothetical protein
MSPEPKWNFFVAVVYVSFVYAGHQIFIILFFMKTRNTLIFLGLLFILLNALSYVKGNTNVPEEHAEYKIAYLIGRNIFFIIGLILLMFAYFRHRKVERKRRKDMVDTFLK